MSNASNVVHLPNNDLREQIVAWMESDRRLTQVAIARETGISASALNQWLKGVYPGDNTALESKLQKWFDHARAQITAGESLPAAPEWVSTPSAERAIAAFKYAQMAGDIAIVYGGAGVGKTKSIARYAQAAPNVWHATVTPASAGVVPALEEICEAIGLREVPNGAQRLYRAIVRRITGTNGLLVVDEAQHLSVAALDQLRAIHDATGIGLALVGNESVYARMTGGNRAAYLDRLFSRIGKKVRLVRSTEADITALIIAWGIEDRSCRAQLVEIASKPGALRVLTKVLRLASMQSRAENRTVCCDDVRAAWRELGGVE